MYQYLFWLGHQPHISTAEIQAVFSQLNIKDKITEKTNEYLTVETKEKINEEELINRLGGTVKIAEKNKENLIELNKIIKCVVEYCKDKQPEGKINFSLSGKNAKNTALQIKKELKSMGRSVRYIEPKNTATILHNKLIDKQGDFMLIDDSLFVSKAIQPFEDFSKKDYGRPDSDSFSGMLPPKLARILINLSSAKPGQIILDPFCGSGTILMEAAHLGFINFIGSDISDKALSDTEKNLEWIKANFHLPHLPYKLLKADAKELDKHLDKEKIDFIITEPYLGKPLKGTETQKDLENQAEELKKLYLNAFSSFAKILKPKTKIIFIIPRFKYQNGWITIDCTSELKKIGFTVEPLTESEDFLLYHRPQQHVGREIWKFSLSS